MKTLVQFLEQDGEKVKLNRAKVDEEIKAKTEKFLETNKAIVAKLEETEKFLKEQVEKLGVTKDFVRTEEPVRVPADKQFKFDDSKLSTIAANIKVEKLEPGSALIGMNTYGEIVEKSLDLAEEEFVKMTQDCRAKRREIRNSDQKNYLKLMTGNLTDVENLLMQSQEDIAAKLGVSHETIEKSEVKLMERGLGQHIFMMQAQIRQRIKERLPKQREINMTKTKEVIKFQTKILKDKQDFLKSLLKEIPQKPESAQLVPLILNMVINDFVFEEFQCEEEDYMMNLMDQKIYEDAAWIELLKGIEEGIMNLLQSLGLLPNAPMGAEGGMPPMGGMPGMF